MFNKAQGNVLFQSECIKLRKAGNRLLHAFVEGENSEVLFLLGDIEIGLYRLKKLVKDNVFVENEDKDANH